MFGYMIAWTIIIAFLAEMISQQHGNEWGYVTIWILSGLVVRLYDKIKKYERENFMEND